MDTWEECQKCGRVHRPVSAIGTDHAINTAQKLKNTARIVKVPVELSEVVVTGGSGIVAYETTKVLSVELEPSERIKYNAYIELRPVNPGSDEWPPDDENKYVVSAIGVDGDNMWKFASIESVAMRDETGVTNGICRTAVKSVGANVASLEELEMVIERVTETCSAGFVSDMTTSHNSKRVRDLAKKVSRRYIEDRSIVQEFDWVV